MPARTQITVEGHLYDALRDGDRVEIVVDHSSEVLTGGWEEEHITGLDDVLPSEAREELEDVLRA